MAKLGLPRHRQTVAILCWLYVIISTLIHIYSIVDKFHGSIFVFFLINLAIGCFGLFSLYKQNGTLMQIFGIILVVKIVTQVLQIVGLLTLTLLRESVLNGFLKELMDKYYDSTDEREIMDDMQQKTSDCTTYYANGCVAALSSTITYIILGYGLIVVGIITVHIYAIVSAFELARVYKQGPITPNIEHSFANF